jgi:hypothetical protein
MDALFTKTTTPFYKGCSSSMLLIMSLLLNLSIVHGVSKNCMYERFSLLQKQ